MSAEAAAAARQYLLNFDANQDGILTFDEIQAKIPNYTNQFFRNVDVNNDGRMTQDEIRNWYTGQASTRTESRPLPPLRRPTVVRLAALSGTAPVPAVSEIEALEPTPNTAASDRDASEASAAHIIEQGDSNGDANLTLREVEAYVPTISRYAFGYLDRDNNRVLTPSEFRPSNALPPARDVAFAETDANDDKEVNFGEATFAAPDLLPRRFAALDADKDGALSQSEMPSPGEIGGPKSLEEFVGTADANKDKVVSFAEAQAYVGMTRARFDAIDTNRDGAISRDDTGISGKETIGATKAEVDVALEADTNHDRKVSLRELRAIRPKFSSELFHRLDGDRDSVVSMNDVP